MIPSLTREEMYKQFETDDDGRFVSLVIPPEEGEPELVLTGRKREELSIDEIVRIKKYSRELFLNRKVPESEH